MSLSLWFRSLELMVLQSVGLPMEGIALIAGVDRILDMIRTCVNITRDAACALIVSATENELDIDIYNSTSKYTNS